jgi:hypothetical protein
MKKLSLRIFTAFLLIPLLLSVKIFAADNQNFPYASGYCAVGELDTANSIATILVDTGEIFTVKYTGTAVSGDIHTYTYDNGTLTLTPADMYKADDGINGRPFWSWWGFVNEDMTYGYLPKDTSSCFVYYSPTEWRVTKGTDMFKITDAGLQTSLMMVTDFVDNGKCNNDSMTARNFDCIMIVGTGVEGATDRIPANASTTAFLDDIGLGWDTGDKTVTAANAVNCVAAAGTATASETTAPAAAETSAPATETASAVTEPVAAPATGSDFIAVIALISVSAAAIALISKKRSK